jgi:lipoate---protein ligase
VEAVSRQGELTADSAVSASSPGWAIERHLGPASTFHALEPTGERLVWWLDVERPALVLGSAQPDTVVDQDACQAAGIEVVRRRSGGGAVLLVPGECVWLDVVVPHGDPLWHDDIGRSMWWLGEVWAEALMSLGCDDVRVHRGPVQHTPWSRLVCFDGLGAGEVTVGGRKAVGISQRRTREWGRLQSCVNLAPLHGVPSISALVDLLAPPRPAVDDLRAPAVIDASIDDVQQAVGAAIGELP